MAKKLAKKAKKPMNATTAIVPAMPRGFVKIEPDDSRYKNKFHVNSATSDRVYRISYDSAPGAGWYICSCPCGLIGKQNCKHLKAIGIHPTKAEVLQRRIGAAPKKLGGRN
jgi:hypothetical protein